MAHFASYAALSGVLIAGSLAIAGCSRGQTTSPTSPVGSPSTTSSAGSASTSTASPGTPMYVDRARWVPDARGRSLRVYPTATGRATRVDVAMAAAWRQVLRLAPAADTPTMKAQFDCHWTFARLAEPDKTSWNLETWRPVVSAQTMFDTRCNPGGPEE